MPPLFARLQVLLRILVVSVALGVPFLLAPLPRVYAAAINVDDDCSLANAIRSANGESQTGAMNSCESGDSGADTINFTRDVALTEALPAITSDMTLEGNKRTLRRDSSAGDMRLLHATGTGSLTINDLTLRDGRPASTDENGYGGAILINTRATTINGSAFMDNAAHTFGGAIAARSADVTINDSTFIGNATTAVQGVGGAIFLVYGGNVSIAGSVFRSNAAWQGGAIHSQPGLQLTIAGSTFVNNRAEHVAGALSASDAVTIRASSFLNNSAGGIGGGGISMQGADALIENSSFHGNRSESTPMLGMALVANTSTVTLRHVTIHNAGGAGEALHVQSGSTLNLVNNVIAGSSGTGCAVSADSSIGTNVNNWIEDGACSATFSGDPMLSTPRGSPAYIPPYIGSGLVDAAPDDANCLATDQLGRARPQGAACDIGAYEGAIPGPPWETSWRSLSGCMATTTARLNLRMSPADRVIGVVPDGSTLSAVSRVDGWFEVDYVGAVGWISADYATTDGSCG